MNRLNSAVNRCLPENKNEYTILLFCIIFFVQVTVAMLNQLISKVKEDLANLETTEETDQISRHLTNTMTHLQLRLQEPSSDGPSYEGLLQL